MRAEGVRRVVHRAVGGVSIGLWLASVRRALCWVLGVSVQCIELWAAGDRLVVCPGSGVSVPCVGL
jgi:hypothetical protein